MKTVAEWLKTEPDPDDIGQSEYRVVHEHVRDIIESADYIYSDDTESADMILASLDELMSHARDKQQSLRRWITP